MPRPVSDRGISQQCLPADRDARATTPNPGTLPSHSERQCPFLTAAPHPLRSPGLFHGLQSLVRRNRKTFAVPVWPCRGSVATEIEISKACSEGCPVTVGSHPSWFSVLGTKRGRWPRGEHFYPGRLPPAYEPVVVVVVVGL